MSTNVDGEPTLRDYFAAKALQGFMANKDRPQHFLPEDDAQWCYRIADAMLAARIAKPPRLGIEPDVRWPRA